MPGQASAGQPSWGDISLASSKIAGFAQPLSIPASGSLVIKVRCGPKAEQHDQGHVTSSVSDHGRASAIPEVLARYWRARGLAPDVSWSRLIRGP